jgi:FHS family Na+ dependent glucose MFS transporter 1
MSTSAPPAAASDNRLPRAFAYFLSFIVLGLILSAFGPTLPGLAGQTGSTLGQISIIFTANALGYIAGSLLGGRLYDRIPGHPVLAAVLLAVGVFLAALPLLAARWMLVVDFLLLGIALGVMDVGGNALIVWLFGRDVGPYMNALHLSFGVGAFLSPILVDRVAVLTGGIRWAYWLLAALMVPVAVWVASTKSPPRPDQGETGQTVSPAAGYTGLTILLAALMFLHVGAELSFGGWIFSYASALGIGTATTARLLNSAYWGALTAGRAVAIPLATRLLPRTMMILNLIGAAASAAVMMLFPGVPLAMWIGTLGLGFFVAPLFPTTINFAERRMPITGKVTGYFLVGANVGSMTVPWVIGQLFETVGPQSMVSTVGAVTLIALALFVVIMRYTRGDARSG